VVLVHEHGSRGRIRLSLPVSHQVYVFRDQTAESTVCTDDKNLVGVNLEALFVFRCGFQLHEGEDALLEEEVLGLLGGEVGADDCVVSEEEEGLVDEEHVGDKVN